MRRAGDLRRTWAAKALAVSAMVVLLQLGLALSGIAPAASGQTRFASRTRRSGAAQTGVPARASAASPSPGSAYTPVTPVRLADTRCSASPQPGFCFSEKLPAQNAGLRTPTPDTTISVQVAGLGGVPADATAVVLNVTALNGSGPGYLTVYPAGSSPATVSSVNWTDAAGGVPNMVTVGLGSNGQVSIYNNSGDTDVIVDLAGYYAPPASGSSTAGLYDAVDPSRLADTRCATSPQPGYCASEHLPAVNGALGTIPQGGTIDVQVTGAGGVPASGVSAVVLNVTVVAPTAGTYVTVFPAGSTRATVSSLNALAGEVVPNRVTVGVGSGGRVSVYNNSGESDVVVDVNGYYTDGSSVTETGGVFTPVNPARIADSRCDVSPAPAFCADEHLPNNGSPLTTFGPGSTQHAYLQGVGEVPASGVSGVDVNVTVVDTSGSSYLSIWPYGSSRPVVSDLNWTPGAQLSNAAVVGVPNRAIDIYNGMGDVDVIVDVDGYFSPAVLTWGSAALVDPLRGEPASVSCPTSGSCVAVDGHGNALTYDGTSWSTPLSVDPSGAPTSVSCPSPSFCAAVDASGNALTYDGSSWVSWGAVGGGLDAVSCASASFCVAGDAQGHALTYNGTSWSAPLSVTSGGIASVSCPTSTFCAAVTNEGGAAVYNGSSWSSATVDCISGYGSSCGGGSYPMTSVSCTSSTFCAAVDRFGNALTYDGSSWSGQNDHQVDIDGTNPLASVSCPAATSCIAVGTDGNAFGFDGTSWSAPASFDPGNGGLTSVSCPASTFCAAVDNHGNVLTYDGTSWSAPFSVDGGGGGLKSVSCPASTFCAAVDWAGNALTYDGTSWSAALSVDSSGGLVSVSCPTSAFCAAVDDHPSSGTQEANGFGNAVTYDGSTWSTDLIEPYLIGSLVSVSCPSPVSCVVVDSAGSALTYDGTSWSAALTVDSSGGLVSVSCPTSAFCAAVDSSGDALTYVDSSWSDPGAADPHGELVSVSCAGANICMALDGYGDAIPTTAAAS